VRREIFLKIAVSVQKRWPVLQLRCNLTVSAGNRNSGKILETRGALRSLLCGTAEGFQQTEVAVPSTQMKMKSMFLPGVEQNPQPGPYAEMIRRAQESGGEYWKIWNLFAFRPEATAHLARFTHAVMHEDAPLTPALRELIAAYTSFQNECEFCTKSHAAIAAELMGNEELVWNVLRDLESAALRENEKALLRFAGKVTHNLSSVSEADAQGLRNIGWTDEQIFYTITVCALFNFYNRWVTSSGVPAVSREGHRGHAQLIARNGYIRK
jgi:uncharacterized peroxidase-related enzyme